jgi:hypothetical protein
VQLQNRLEALLEEAHIKVSSVVSDLLGVSARRMLQALADGEADPTTLANLRLIARTAAGTAQAIAPHSEGRRQGSRTLRSLLTPVQVLDESALLLSVKPKTGEKPVRIDSSC